MLIWSDTLYVVVAALAFDAFIGDPDWLWRRLPHPVALGGALIGFLDRKLNRDKRSPMHRKLAGVSVMILLLAVSAVSGFLIELALRQIAFGHLLDGLIASTLIAQRSLYQHVAQVRAAFADGGLSEARRAVSMIVGRDPDRLDEAGVSRAAIESCAESFSDGVVAPAFWLALLGLPGLIAYKAINTADSIIGHLSPRYQSFGWAAARLDDLVNLIPARLSGFLVAMVAPVAGGSTIAALKVMWRDAGKHRSPNAGWPESATAGALGLALAGPRRYGERVVDDAFLNAAARKDATPGEIGRALNLLIAACLLQAAVYATLVLVT
ncbi:adenosylcobinamide-phosphate synthase CbiB [Bradyrhizobium sp. BWA-3-5]|uniref:adenosylcobinamide-phosphate synthase CbiB n=1 Tax=Bradyrhizobium sp. BWA-3-5 TaxID=3080013 RepID=UPI00293EDBF4|nr:adenosylcobinamide-phosphate synthase CbiB [Bradyrhizobium sp. BWA-3-5]WOH64794.1 adenosylcobinamide-phosphate synthase CbiB [Bradyrhizobium sp. BWA-3-5]